MATTGLWLVWVQNNSQPWAVVKAKTKDRAWLKLEDYLYRDAKRHPPAGMIMRSEFVSIQLNESTLEEVTKQRLRELRGRRLKLIR